MTISICIPTYNRPDFLIRAIRSCLDQTFLPSEIIIGDDSKNEASKLLVEQLVQTNHLPVKINYHKHPVSKGQANNVNALIALTHSEWFVLLHDDDMLVNTALKDMTDYISSYPHIDMVYGKQYLIDESDKIDLEHSDYFNNLYFRTPTYEGNNINSFEAGLIQQIPNNGYLLRTKIAKQISYRNAPEVGDACDFDFGFRIGLAGYKLGYLDRFTSKYRLTKNSISLSNTDFAYRAYKLILPYYRSSLDRDRLVQIALSRKSAPAVVEAIQKGKVSDGWSIYFSPFHRDKIFTLGGFKRIIQLIYASLMLIHGRAN
ncbi:glycosyltransferase family 2 protein [Anditalea andensis]|uniref:Glycosyltransferase 2-like domain-containing protein n=1 Tax=Anditalea andensis TaxID=1048983 RepID=A0A074KQS5_9BACT|nr:glycosyltransferase family 2 protein [Anditalea andensis]KEO72301.1 hypothetical protein EL17_16250 [Anditalea andensis]